MSSTRPLGASPEVSSLPPVVSGLEVTPGRDERSALAWVQAVLGTQASHATLDMPAARGDGGGLSSMADVSKLNPSWLLSYWRYASSNKHHPLKATEALIAGGQLGSEIYVNSRTSNADAGTADVAMRMESLLGALHPEPTPESREVQSNLRTFAQLVDQMGLTKSMTASRSGVRLAIKTALEKLQADGSVLIPSHSRDHAMYLKLSRNADGTVAATLYNSGSGLGQWHRKDTHSEDKFATSWKIDQIPAEKIQGLVKQTLGAYAYVNQRLTVDDVYKRLNALSPEELVSPGANHGKPETEGLFQRRQKGNDCTAEGLFSYLRNNLGFTDYKTLKSEYLFEVARLLRSAQRPDGTFELTQGRQVIRLTQAQGDEIIKDMVRRAVAAEDRSLITDPRRIPAQLTDVLKNLTQQGHEVIVVVTNNDPQPEYRLLIGGGTFDSKLRHTLSEAMSAGVKIVDYSYLSDSAFQTAMFKASQGALYVNRGSFESGSSSASPNSSRPQSHQSLTDLAPPAEVTPPDSTQADDGSGGAISQGQILTPAEAEARLSRDREHRGGSLPSEAVSDFQFTGDQPVEVVTTTRSNPADQPGLAPTVTETTAYTQTQSDGRVITISVTRPREGADSVWTRTVRSADAQTTREVSFFGRDGRTDTLIEVLPDGRQKQTIDTRAPSSVAAQWPDAAFSHTERILGYQEDFGETISEKTWQGPTAASARAGAPGLGAYEWKEVTISEEMRDGVKVTTERGVSVTEKAGKKSLAKTTTETAHRPEGDVILKSTIDATPSSGVSVRSEFAAGQEPQYLVREANGQYVLESQTRRSPSVKRALAELRLCSIAKLAGQVLKRGAQSVASLFSSKPLPASPEAQAEWVGQQLEALGGEAVKASYTRGGLNGGMGALSLYGGVMGLVGLPDAIRVGDTYAITQASVGTAAGLAGTAQAAADVASLASKSTSALSVASKAAKVGGLLGAVALGMEVPNLVKAIQQGDTKAIVNSAVNIGGGLGAIGAGVAANIIAGSSAGGPIGLAVGLVVGLGTIAFSALWNKLFNQGTPLTGPDPLAGVDQVARSEILGHVQALYSEWDRLGGDPNAERFNEWAQPASGQSDAVLAASQFFVDHPEFVSWLDAAGTGDLNERDASFHGNISKADLTRYMVHLAVPAEVFNQLPPPSNEARLWAAGVIHQDFDLVNAFGKDGDGQAGGDADIGLPELLNIGSGLYDDTVRQQLVQKYPGEGAEHEGWIQWKLDNLKKACAYVGFNASEASYIDTVRTGKEDNQLAPADFEKIYTEHRHQVEQLLRDHPHGLDSFAELTQQHTQLGDANPALWRPDRWYQVNADRPDSFWQVLLEHRERFESLDWSGLTRAREQALQDKDYPLYYAIDYVMSNGGELFENRGEGADLALSWSDIENQLADEAQAVEA